ncbi:sphingosine kinase 2-like isoform X2 [Phymastichus coffea]|uniref:sphingosine kinase 2-like isoform X2 n=1 Tax=Phymastichus coffea TaxID=108790 RepID=UPI00273A7BD8|nr:sphingosine kinase 2-like isoform X2 [Phymastichus coffea]
MRKDAEMSQAAEEQRKDAILEETFYVSSKRNTVYRVRLSERGLSLRKESHCGNAASKTETIRVDDIVGCRCMRSKRRSAGSCACGPGASRGQPRLVESTETVQPSDEYDSSAYLYVYAYTLKRRRRERMTVTLRFRSFDRYEDNLREASRWRLAVKCLVAGEPIPKPYMSPAHRNLQSLLSACPTELKNLLVILNPKSGLGRGREAFQRRVHPILSEAELTYDLYITRHSNYARDLVRTRDLGQWSGLVLVGGDGIVFEAINGLLQRPDWDTCIKRLPIGVIPCGSGNGLAKSIAFSKGEPFDQNPMLISALSVVRRRLNRMDLVRVETRKQTLFSFLSVGWGFLADIDIESERLRAIGGQRFTVWSLARLINLRTYKGVVSYLACEAQTNGLGKSNGDARISHSKSCGDDLDHFASEIRESRSFDGMFDVDERAFEVKDECDYAELQDKGRGVVTETLALETSGNEAATTGLRRRCDSFYSARSRKSAYFSTGSGSISSTYHSVEDLNDSNLESSNITYGPPSSLPALTTKVPSSWTRIEGEFIMVQAAYQSHLGQDCLFAPQAKLNDGIIWLLIIKAGISRTNLLQFLLGFSTGSHLSCPNVEMIPVRAFRIEPAEDSSGLLTVDGEQVDYGPLQGEIFPSLATVMCP